MTRIQALICEVGGELKSRSCVVCVIIMAEDTTATQPHYGRKQKAGDGDARPAVTGAHIGYYWPLWASRASKSQWQKPSRERAMTID
jgi:hypothetical protein